MRQLQDYCAVFIVPQRDKPKEFGGNTPWCRIEDIQGKYLNGTRSGQYVSEETIKKMNLKVIPEGAVICSCSASLGVQAIVVTPCITNQTFIGIVPKEELNKEFLYYLLKSKSAYFKKIGTGTTIPYISRKKFEQLPVPGLTLTEQTKVVRILNHAEMIIEHRKKELLRLDELVKARFVEMFGDPVANPKGWETYQLNDCLKWIDNGKSFVCSDKPRGGDYPAVLKLSAATYGDYRPEENKALLDENQFVEGAEVHAGDLLFTRKNTPELVGMAAYVHETPERLMMPDLIFRLVTNDRMNPVFLWQLINCKEFRPIIQGISGGSAKSMSNISKERLGRINVICPPRQIQDQLVPFAHQVDKSKAVIQKSLDETQLLFDSLMQKYFG